MKYIKKIVWVIVSLLAIIAIFFLLSLLTSLKKNDPTPIATLSPVPTVDVSYGKKLIQTLRQRPTPIAKTDIQAKEDILTPLNGKSGIITENSSFRLSYLKAANQFEAIIKTFPVDQTKEEVVTYLKNAGLTEDGICKLPLIFYADITIGTELSKTNMPFSPIPSFCL